MIQQIRSRKSQIAMEYLILLATLMLISVVIVAYVWEPRESAQVSQASTSFDTIVNYANSVTTLGPGNVMQLQVEIPPGVTRIDYQNGELVMIFSEGDEVEGEISRQFNREVHSEVTGFFDTRRRQEISLPQGQVTLLFESMGKGTCIYRPGEREQDCYCFSEENKDVEFISPSGFGGNQIEVCRLLPNGNEQCRSLPRNNILPNEFTYGDTITKLRTSCDYEVVGKSNAIATVVYTITNWRGEIVYEGIVEERDADGFYTLEGEYSIRNSGPLLVTATCRHECYGVDPSDELEDETYGLPYIPHGRIEPYFVDSTNNIVFDDTLQYSAQPLNEDPHSIFDMRRGYVRSGDQFAMRTGFKCLDAECIMINAALNFEGYYSEIN